MVQTLPDPETQAEFYAGVQLKRLLAWLVDAALISAGVLAFGLLTFGLGLLLFPLLSLAANFAYRALTLARFSATPGMWLMAIEIRNAQGQRLSGQEAVLHTVLHLACFALLLPQIASCVMVALRPRHDGLHDLPLGTTAINRPG
ncbi:MAG: RDD family protein [Pseudomonadota bacterium]